MENGGREGGEGVIYNGGNISRASEVLVAHPRGRGKEHRGVTH
jgi:hypothetical protein